MRHASSFTWIRLRLAIVASRLAEAPAWQTALFGLILVTNLAGSVILIPLVIPIVDDLDRGVLVGTALLLFAGLSSFSIHLLISEGTDWRQRGRHIDPMDLLPVPPRWTFHLQVMEESLTDPAAIGVVVPPLLGIACASDVPLLTIPAMVIVAMAVVAMMSGIRITASRTMMTFFTPDRIRIAVRLGAYLALVLTVTVGGSLLYDLFVISRADESGFEPIDLLTARLALPWLSGYLDSPRSFQLCPLSWPVLSLTGRVESLAWLAALVLGAIVGLRLMARVNAALLGRPPVEETGGKAAGSAVGSWPLLHRWMPVSPRALVDLEATIARNTGMLSEALLESVLLVGSLLLLTAISPGAFDRTFSDGLRVFSLFLLLLLTPPAAAFARQSDGITLRRLLPASEFEIVLARVPICVLRNLILVAPTAVLLYLHVPPPSLVAGAGVAGLFALFAFVSALAAVACGMMTVPLDGSRSGIGAQLTALILCGLAVAPLLLFSVGGDVFRAAAGALATGLMIAGLWQRALARLRYLAQPGPGDAPATMLGDAAIAAVLYLLTGSALSVLLRGAFWWMDTEPLLLLHLAALQLLVLRYGVGYLTMRERSTGEGRALGGPARSAGLGLVLGIPFGLGTLGYGSLVARYFEVGETGHPLTRLVGEFGQEPGLAIAAVLVAGVLAPFAEEVLFRRYLFVGLRQATGSFALAAGLSSLLFALVHPPIGLPVIFVMAFVSCRLYEVHRSLMPCATFHMGFNLTQLLAIVLVGGTGG